MCVHIYTCVCLMFILQSEQLLACVLTSQHSKEHFLPHHCFCTFDLPTGLQKISKINEYFSLRKLYLMNLVLCTDIFRKHSRYFYLIIKNGVNSIENSHFINILFRNKVLVTYTLIHLPSCVLISDTVIGVTYKKFILQSHAPELQKANCT